MASSDEPLCKRRLIIKFSKKPIITCYWLPKNNIPPTIQENFSKVVKENVVVGTHNNTMDDCSKPPTTILNPQKLRKFVVDDVSLATSNNGKRRPFLLVKKENRVDEGLCATSSKNNGFTQIGLIKNENQKKPIEHYKKMQCWVILKRMIEGRDGWALKNPLDQKYLKGLDQKNVKAIGLIDIEAKLKSSYSTTDEFAKDMRFVFSHGLLYHPKNIVHKIALKFSEIFENKWKSLNEEWTLEEKRLKHNKIHKRKRESSVLSPKSDTLSMILKEQSKMYGSFKEMSRKMRLIK